MLNRIRQKNQDRAFRKQYLEDQLNERMLAGEKKYGKYDPATDKRDLLAEMREEAADIINYCRMHRMKHKQFMYNIERLAEELYLETFDA